MWLNKSKIQPMIGGENPKFAFGNKDFEVKILFCP